MVVRCGYEWTGHPTTIDGQIYSLHGKAQNTPASYVAVEIDEKPPFAIHVKGLIKESTLFKLHDVLTNHADYAHDYQIIYHSNFSQPILEEGAKNS
ncbi:DUF4432 family protein [Acinetobacter nectaris]|uniref:DUF4432 family protein n=1 Tax=Acinetobacter nectaris TaxID=1219382 RepID=UPI001F1999B3|nr:DUF4432 family protein [Acinetobacter nectaris]MCF9000076.1 DUF4432 family protein [Acinetobacter nectaris]MCF9027030.1 DUF4432 family protein [Acinetobacter nectaris]